jgi:pilus assembly protein CpaB
MLKSVDWPSGSVPSGAVSDAQSLQDRVIKTSILRGEPILESKLAPIGSKGGLSAVIPEGKRAMTVRVNDVIGVAGFALPATAWISWSPPNSTAKGGRQADLQDRLEHILVLAWQQEADRDETKPSGERGHAGAHPRAPSSISRAAWARLAGVAQSSGR